MIYRARTESNEMFIAMYETEEPKIGSYCIDGGAYFESQFDRMKHTEWQSSKREYKVRDGDKWEVINELTKRWIQSSSSISFHKELQKVIDCTFLKDRLKLEEKQCDNRACKRHNKCLGIEAVGCCKNTFEWTLLPLEDKKENEAGKWISVKDRMPSQNNLVFVATQVGGTSTMFHENGIWRYAYNSGIIDAALKITHWMPLPEPPNIQEPE